MGRVWERPAKVLDVVAAAGAVPVRSGAGAEG